MAERVEFRAKITLTKHEVLELVAGCEEVAERAERLGSVEIGFAAEQMKRVLLGRLMRGRPGRG